MKTTSINQLGLVCLETMLATACALHNSSTLPLPTTTSSSLPGSAKSMAKASQSVSPAPSTVTRVEMGNAFTCSSKWYICRKYFRKQCRRQSLYNSKWYTRRWLNYQTERSSGTPAGKSSRGAAVSATTKRTRENDSKKRNTAKAMVVRTISRAGIASA